VSRFAYCQFADDVRIEVGNKTTIVGVYGTDMYVSNVPAFLPKLCILAYFNSPIEEQVESLTVTITFDDEVLQRIEVPSESLKRLESAARKGDSTLTRQFYGSRATISPFVIPKEGTLSVNVLADGQDFLAGRLRIKHVEVAAIP
jgi:hypothetical protein